MTVAWCIWRSRNIIKFNDKIGDVEEILFKVKMFTWSWLAIAVKDRIKCNFVNGKNTLLITLNRFNCMLILGLVVYPSTLI